MAYEVTVKHDTYGRTKEIDTASFKKGGDIVFSLKIILDSNFPEYGTTSGDLTQYKLLFQIRNLGKEDVVYQQVETDMTVSSDKTVITIPYTQTTSFSWNSANYLLIVRNAGDTFRHVVLQGKMFLSDLSGV